MTSDLIGEWTTYHHNLNNISHYRRITQLRVLRQLEATLPGPVDRVDSRDLERYMAQLIRDGYHPHYVLSQLRLIMPFLRWMWREGMIDAERWLRLKDVRGPRGAYDGKPRPYTRAEIRQFWIALDKQYPWTRDKDPRQRTPARGEYWVRRWAMGYSPWRRVWPYARRLQVEAIVALALYAGLRRDEIFKIDIEDMHYMNEYVRVVSRKGPEAHEKVRVVAMNDAIALAVGNWLEFRAQVLNPQHEKPWLCLFAGNAQIDSAVTDPMNHSQFVRVMSSIGEGWEFHRLRHTFATFRYQAGMPIEILQEVMGHSTITQTLGYARIDADRIIAASRASDDAFLQSVDRNREDT